MTETLRCTNPACFAMHPVTAGEWKDLPGFTGYQSATAPIPGTLDQVRSVERFVNGRRYRGVVIASRLSTRGYPQVTIPGDDGKLHTIAVHALVMLAHEGPCPPGLQVRHWNDDPLDNRWAPGGEDGCRAGAGNLVYGTPKEQWQDKLRNRPSPPRRSRGVTSAVRARVGHVASRLRRWRV